MSELLHCDSDRRRADLLEAGAELGTNGIDYVEVDPADHRIVRVFFLLELPPADPADPDSATDAYGLAASGGEKITITGGVRVIGIEAVSAERRIDPAVHPEPFLEVRVDRAGDHSPYTISLTTEALDPRRSSAPLSFVASCPVDHDCAPIERCPPPEAPELDLDYMAKDYASFRQMLLDLLPRLNPSWTERSPVDLGVMLVELLAYEGDQLSYAQDAAATEAYLETARRRTSVRRHARLVDYRVHEGRNAWAWVHLGVNQANVLAARTRVVSRLELSPVGAANPPEAILSPKPGGPPLLTAETLEADPALAGAVVFETARDLRTNPLENEMRIHTWGEEECCLAGGAREAFLYAIRGGKAVTPSLEPGQHILLEEVLGVHTGDEDYRGREGSEGRDDRDVWGPDRNPEARAVVTLVSVHETDDPLYSDELGDDGTPRLRAAGEDELPLLKIRWRSEDALERPLCLSVRLDSDRIVEAVSVARGNVVAADEGLTVGETLEPPDLRLGRGPLVWQHGRFRPGAPSPPGPAEPDPDRRRGSLDDEPADALAAIELTAVSASGEEIWRTVPDLLDSTPYERHFVVETDEVGRASLRFGDGVYGRRLGTVERLEVAYRIGTGSEGNVGADSLGHVVLEPGAPKWIDRIYNPLPARAGADPETLEAVRRDAPVAFHTSQIRAVTPEDYAEAAAELDSVAGAVAAFRWTGSWQTVFVGIDPADSADLLTDVRGRIRLSGALEAEVRAQLDRRRLAGRDLELRAPEYVPIALGIEVCAAPDHFRGDVAREVAEALSDRELRGGTRGLFHSDRLGFGDPVYLSAVYAAAAEVPGVDSVTVRRFRRYREREAGELERGVLGIGAWEVAQLRNDPSFPEHGVLEITALGGKA